MESEARRGHVAAIAQRLGQRDGVAETVHHGDVRGVLFAERVVLAKGDLVIV